MFVRHRDRLKSAEPPSTGEATCAFPGSHAEGLPVQQERVTFPVAQSQQEAPRTLDLYKSPPTAPVNSISRIFAVYKPSNSQRFETTAVQLAGVILRVD